MKRRDFINLAAIGGRLSAGAQEPRRVIGVLGGASYGSYPGTEDAFLKGLTEAGFVQGQNISIDWR
jgi:hypothetical protein